MVNGYMMPMQGIERVHMDVCCTAVVALDTDVLGTIDACIDTGASLCAIKGSVARRYAHLITKPRRAFKAQTANGATVLHEAITITFTEKGKRRPTLTKIFM